MDISTSLVALRKKAGMKQIEAAKIIGVSQTYMSQIESGNKEPSTGLLKDICKAYDIPPSVMYWMAMTVDDVPKRKQKIFLELKPVIDNLIHQFI